MVCVVEDEFGTVQDPLTGKALKVRRFTMTNCHQLSVSVITRGATVTSIKFPDKRGQIDDVCLGFDDVQGYVSNRKSYMGAILGRVANRISNGKFEMACSEVCVSKNLSNKHQLHGGFVGLDSVVWEVCKVRSNGLDLTHCNPSGHEGYPGELTVIVSFTLDDCNSFRICIEAESTDCTPVNISNNIHFNLAGHAAGKESLYEHSVLIKADKVVDTDNDQIPTGMLMPVKNTPYDVRKFTNLGKTIKKFRNCPITGFDKSFCVDVRPGNPETIAKIVHPYSGRWLEVITNQPTVVFYTANNLPNMDATEYPVIGKDGAIYEKHGAFSFQTQQYPDAMNHKTFPDVILKPCDKYYHEVIFKFGACKNCLKK
uniref:Aldose 1-epimerase n=1 Tax=Glossina morsitans morsitans TaxID=37546 RepID=A0A1B0G2S3_GLOMM